VSGIATGVGLLLVWMFSTMSEDLFNLHYKGVMVIIPAMVTTIFMGAFWPRFNAWGASVAMVGGSTVNLLSVTHESWIEPLSRFVLAEPPAGIDPNYSLFRGLFGVVVTAIIGIVVTMLTPKQSEAKIRGLTVFSLGEAMRAFKDGIPNFKPSRTPTVKALALQVDESAGEHIRLPSPVMESLAVEEGDLVYVADDRWWLGGIRSVQLKAGAPAPGDAIIVSAASVDKGSLLPKQKHRAEKIF